MAEAQSSTPRRGADVATGIAAPRFFRGIELVIRTRTPNGPTHSAGTLRFRRERLSGYESHYNAIYTRFTATFRE